ncbi:MAG TPA: hypothetical protein V6D17_10565 [Candidatus Obscuribacterales bacterium]
MIERRSRPLNSLSASFAAVIALFAWGGLASSEAADRSSSAKQSATNYQSAAQAQADDYSTVPLLSPVDCPDLPRYTGKQKFIGGTCSPRRKGGKSYIQRFAAQEEAATVSNWYKSALQASGQWKIFKERGNNIMASHAKGHECFVFFYGNPEKNERCRYTLRVFIHD